MCSAKLKQSFFFFVNLLNGQSVNDGECLWHSVLGSEEHHGHSPSKTGMASTHRIEQCLFTSYRFWTYGIGWIFVWRDLVCEW